MKLLGLSALALTIAPLGGLAAAAAPATLAVPADPARIAAAATEFSAKIEPLGQSNAPVSVLRTAPIAPLFRDTFDIAGIRSLPNDTEAVSSACGPVIAAFQSMANFASGTGQDNSRFLSLQAEVVTATLATTLCAKRMIKSIDGYVVALPANQRTAERRAGARQMMDGFGGMIGGILMMQSDSGFLPANRARLLEGLLEEMDVLAAALPLADRAKIRAEILDYAGKGDAPTRATLTRMAAFFAHTDCGTICSFIGGK